MDKAVVSEQHKNRLRIFTLELAPLALLVLSYAIAARLVGSDRSMLPWLW
jgi:hypothetical protein